MPNSIRSCTGFASRTLKVDLHMLHRNAELADSVRARPAVDVLILAFNHERFIRQALDGVLMQQTTFPVYITVLEDCSTDATRDILSDYAGKCATRLHIHLATRNQNNNRALMDALVSSDADYVAVIDGDDYWTYEGKLQKQVDFLAANPAYALVYHNVHVVTEDAAPGSVVKNPVGHTTVSTIHDLFVRNSIATCAALYRRSSLVNIPDWFEHVAAADWNLHLLAARNGLIAYDDAVMAAYRVHAAGYWSGLSPAHKRDFALSALREMKGHFDVQYHESIDKGIANAEGCSVLSSHVQPAPIDSSERSQTNGEPNNLCSEADDDPELERIQGYAAEERSALQRRLDRPVSMWPDVAVVIPCYNQARYLSAAIESVLAQTHAPAEVVVVDDGSEDDIKAVTARWSSIRCLRQANSGLAAARNAGFRETRSPYIVFLDADDVLLPNALEEGLAALLKSPDAALSYGRFYRMNTEGRHIEAHHADRVTTDHYVQLLQRNYLSLASVMFRRTSLAQTSLFDSSINWAADYDLLLHLSRRWLCVDHGTVIASRRVYPEQASKRYGAMLDASMCVLHRQVGYVRGDPRLYRAYRSGCRHYREWYGEQLVTATFISIQKRRWTEAIKSCRTLARHYPVGLRALARGIRMSNRVLIPGVAEEAGPDDRLRHKPHALTILKVNPSCATNDPWPTRMDDGRMVLTVQCVNASPRTVVVLDGEPLESECARPDCVTAIVPRELADTEAHEVYLLK
jgi:glycosyltransferase involved in cell wall biosynthesis